MSFRSCVSMTMPMAVRVIMVMVMAVSRDCVGDAGILLEFLYASSVERSRVSTSRLLTCVRELFYD
jgi:hypothetical protein